MVDSSYTENTSFQGEFCIQSAFTLSKLTIETLEQGMKYIHSVHLLPVLLVGWTSHQIFKKGA